MADLILVKKFLYWILWVGAFPILAQAADIVHRNSTFSVVFVSICFFTTCLPELLMFFKDYRKEIISGIQDGDGVTNSKDLQFIVPIYISFWCGRSIVWMILYSMIEPFEIRTDILIILGSIGLGSIAKSLIKKSNS